MIVPALGFFFGCVVTALFFAWLDDRRRAAEAAGWCPERARIDALARTSPRGFAPSWVDREDGATGSATRRATFEQTDRLSVPFHAPHGASPALVAGASTAGRSRAASDRPAVLLTDR